ncbi:MAG: DnaA/Hda family protein, partial [Verrucomicrobiota bacterium]
MDKNPNPSLLKSLWDKISTALRSEVSGEVFDRWFKAVEPVEINGQHITLKVPNDIYRYWIEDNYIGSLRAAILLVAKGDLEVRFVCDGAAAMPEPEVHRAPVPAPATEAEIEEKAVANGMNPRNTFETFVVGANNQFAHAACSAVAKTPGKVYNPLFFYGGVGLGKTHLMHAIGQHVLANRKGAKVSYVTSEKFTNEFIDAIQNGTLVKFRKRYRQVDVLLIDDIQFLAGK